MVAVPTSRQAYIESLLAAGDDDIEQAVVSGTREERRKYANIWQIFRRKYFTGYTDFLTMPDGSALSQQEVVEIMVAFAKHIRKGDHGTNKQMRASVVAVAIRSVSAFIELDGRKNPIKENGKHLYTTPPIYTIDFVNMCRLVWSGGAGLFGQPLPSLAFLRERLLALFV